MVFNVFRRKSHSAVSEEVAPDALISLIFVHQRSVLSAPWSALDEDDDVIDTTADYSLESNSSTHSFATQLALRHSAAFFSPCDQMMEMPGSCRLSTRTSLCARGDIKFSQSRCQMLIRWCFNFQFHRHVLLVTVWRTGMFYIFRDTYMYVRYNRSIMHTVEQ